MPTPPNHNHNNSTTTITTIGIAVVVTIIIIIIIFFSFFFITVIIVVKWGGGGGRLLQLAVEKGLYVTQPTAITPAPQAPATAQPAAHRGLSITRPISTATRPAQQVPTTKPEVIVNQSRDEAKAPAATDDDEECTDKKSVDLHRDDIDELSKLFKRGHCPTDVTRMGFRVLDTLEST